MLLDSGETTHPMPHTTIWPTKVQALCLLPAILNDCRVNLILCKNQTFASRDWSSPQGLVVGEVTADETLKQASCPRPDRSIDQPKSARASELWFALLVPGD